MNIDQKSVDELRVLSNEMITNAKSGHPGIALGGAPIIYSLYANILAVNSADSKNMFRDRFVLSAGHGSSVLYSTLYAMGFGLSKQDLKEFRRINSKTPGHPEVDMTAGVDASTGPLGQGVSNAVGLAIAEKWYAANFNKPDLKLFDSTIYCMTGDGCLMEGISYEALSIAGNLNLDNIVLIYDYNQITIEGKTEITFTENIEPKYQEHHEKTESTGCNANLQHCNDKGHGIRQDRTTVRPDHHGKRREQGMPGIFCRLCPRQSRAGLCTRRRQQYRHAAGRAKHH